MDLADRVEGTKGLIEFFVAFRIKERKLAEEYRDAFADNAEERRIHDLVMQRFVDRLDSARESTREEDARFFDETDVADALSHGVQIAAGMILLAIDDMFRRLARAMKIGKGVKLRAGPLVGLGGSPAKCVPFTTLVAAGGNSVRHIGDWVNLPFENGRYVGPFKNNELDSIDPIRQALGLQGKIESDVAFGILDVLAADPKTLAPSFGVLVARIEDSAREIANEAGLLAEFELSATYRPRVG